MVTCNKKNKKIIIIIIIIIKSVNNRGNVCSLKIPNSRNTPNMSTPRVASKCRASERSSQYNIAL